VAKKSGEGDQKKPKSPGRRKPITLTPFQWWQIDSLEGIYAASVPEVLKRAVLEWLQEHHDEIEQQKRDHQQFLSQQKRSTSTEGAK
jgi:hypothetical protein